MVPQQGQLAAGSRGGTWAELDRLEPVQVHDG